MCTVFLSSQQDCIPLVKPALLHDLVARAARALAGRYTAQCEQMSRAAPRAKGYTGLASAFRSHYAYARRPYRTKSDLVWLQLNF